MLPTAPSHVTAGSFEMASSDNHSILLELFRATNGPSWINNRGWNTSESLSTWYGVTVDGDGHVVRLELRDNNLEGNVYLEI